MAYDQALAARVEAVLAELNPPNLENKKMFGGVGYLVRGNMACGIHKDNLVVCVGKGGYEDALSQPGVDVFDITGRPMTGWVLLAPAAVKASADLRAWVEKGLAFTRTLPEK
jgi:hypothetical protein